MKTKDQDKTLRLAHHKLLNWHITLWCKDGIIYDQGDEHRIGTVYINGSLFETDKKFIRLDIEL
jgi:hypothetical protein